MQRGQCAYRIEMRRLTVLPYSGITSVLPRRITVPPPKGCSQAHKASKYDNDIRNGGGESGGDARGEQMAGDELAQMTQ